MPRFSELLPIPPCNAWEAVIAAWAALLTGDGVTPIKRRIAQQAMEEGLMPADLAVILGTSEAKLTDYFIRGESLELEDDAVVLLKRVLGLPAIAVRVGLAQLRLTDLMSAAALRHAQAFLQQRHPRYAALWEAEEIVALFLVLSGQCGDVPGSERELLPPPAQACSVTRRKTTEKSQSIGHNY